ncbi:hypothetical protein ELQ35_20890 [Peribacillus cavernae]|uniref:LXG domain-containing protein n=1 Tax=Peribacillus cavernae TaxID=1674310 RepID=A0A3S0VUJ2_9BACI|nr:LXG domain-containing protein [Peribacillus cavernae]MDQ0221244.1 archaellum component FlaC [Peribacillus cavernae]RUQ25125.1 hypothetical protein ELQ35_20890 [Peribacillus cavernae]
MKILDVDSLIAELEVSLKMIDDQQERIKQIASDVKDIYSLDESFQGEGAKAIKSFYQEGHAPFLVAYDHFLAKFRRAVNGINDAYPAVEPEQKGFVRESFLQNDVQNSLKDLKGNTMEMTDEVNALVDKVQDIISLPKIRDDDVLKGINSAQERVEDTIEDLQKFDEEETKELADIENELDILAKYVKDLESMFKSGTMSVSNFNINQLQKTESYQNMQKKMDEIDWTAIPVTSTPSILFDATAPVSSYGNTFGTLAEGVALTETAYKVGRYGVNITRVGDKYIVKNGKYMDIKGKDFHRSYINSQVKAGNNLEIAKHVHPAAAVKDAFKSKLGFLGIGITAGENAYKNIESNASTSRVIGDTAVDVGLGAVSLASGALLVSAAASFGAPLIGAAVIGFGFSIAASYVIDGIKFGKNEKNLSQGLKDDVQKGIKTVAGWFK